MSFVERVNQGESLASWLNWLTEAPSCVLVCDHGGLISQLKRGFLDPFKGLQNGSTKLSCAQHDNSSPYVFSASHSQYRCLILSQIFSFCFVVPHGAWL